MFIYIYGGARIYFSDAPLFGRFASFLIGTFAVGPFINNAASVNIYISGIRIVGSVNLIY